MVQHLGLFDVPVSFLPPDGAKPGDTATLQFQRAQLFVTLPADWTPGQPVLFTPPAQAQQQLQQNTQKSAKQQRSCEQMLGIATAGIGVLGLTVGSTYIGVIYPGSVGFALGMSFLLVSGAFLWQFERWCSRELVSTQTHAALLALAIAFTAAAFGAAFAQAAANYNASIAGLVILLVWVAVQVLFVGAVMMYMVSLKRHGANGMEARGSFLPIFFTSASCIVVMWVILWLLHEGGVPWSSGIVHGVALILAVTATVVGRLAPWMAISQPKEQIVFLPGLMTSVSLLCLCLVCLRDATTMNDLGIPVRTAAYAVGFILFLAIGAPRNDLRGVMLVQITCFLVLGAFIICTLDAFAAERWVVVLFSAAASYFCTAQIRKSRHKGNKSELQSIGTKETHEEGEASTKKTRAEVEQSTTETHERMEASQIEEPKDTANAGEQKDSGCLSALENLHLFGSLLLCLVAVLRMADETTNPSTAMPLMMGVPVSILSFHIVTHPSENALYIALAGFIFSAIPYRIIVHQAADWVYEIMLLLCPGVLFGIFGLSQLQSPMDKYLPAAAICLLCLERVSPIALITFGLVAFGLAWKMPSPHMLAVVIFVWELRGGMSAWGNVDHLLFPQEAVAFIIGLGAWAIVSLCVFIREETNHHWFLFALPPVSIFLAPLSAGFACPIPAISAMTHAIVQPSWVGSVMAPMLVFVAINVMESCGFEYSCQPSPFDSTVSSGVIASLSAFILAVCVTIRVNRNSGADGSCDNTNPANKADSSRSIPAVVLWIMALFLHVVSADNGLSLWLALLYVGTLTCMMVIAHLPWLHAWYMLPGLWVVAIGKAGATTDQALLAALVTGALLMMMPWLTKNIPSLLGNLESTQVDSLEPAGLFWLTIGAAFGLFQQGSMGQIGAIAVFTGVGMVELVCGLQLAGQDSWRRITGMLAICAAIFLGAIATHGLLQGVLIVIGSLMAIAMAVLVATTQSSAPSDAVDNNESLPILSDENMQTV